MSSTPAQVGTATAAALRAGKTSVWIPAPLSGLALALRLVPRPLWRRVSR
jgi:decaprenylphospho-beta-D-erythro-pentofuranosid-2-ulose 2-reductase